MRLFVCSCLFSLCVLFFFFFFFFVMLFVCLVLSCLFDALRVCSLAACLCCSRLFSPGMCVCFCFFVVCVLFGVWLFYVFVLLFYDLVVDYGELPSWKEFVVELRGVVRNSISSAMIIVRPIATVLSVYELL